MFYNGKFKARRAIADINVVPYIDVMLVLLVIFMVTAPLIVPAIVNVPTVGGAGIKQQAIPLIVNIDNVGHLSVRYQDGGQMREQTLLKNSALNLFIKKRQQAHADQPVVIAADKHVQYDTVMKVMADLKAQHVKRVGLLVRSQ